MTRWPDALLQPSMDTGCIEHSVAYLAHCLGFTQVTPEMVAEAQGAESPACERYIPAVLHYPVELWWQHKDNDAERRLWWLGANARPWVEARIADGQVALVIVERVPGRAHAVALLDTEGEHGVFIMDPLYGHRTESWNWFLGLGAARHGAHFVAGWYRLPTRHEDAGD